MSSFDAWVAYLDTLPLRRITDADLARISGLSVQGQEMMLGLVQHGNPDPLPFSGRRTGTGAVWATAHLPTVIQSRIAHALEAYPY